jgi:hypothetical protein
MEVCLESQISILRHVGWTVKLKISKPPVRCGFLKIIRDLEGPRERVRSISDTKRSLSRHLLFKNVWGVWRWDWPHCVVPWREVGVRGHGVRRTCFWNEYFPSTAYAKRSTSPVTWTSDWMSRLLSYYLSIRWPIDVCTSSQWSREWSRKWILAIFIIQTS